MEISEKEKEVLDKVVNAIRSIWDNFKRNFSKIVKQVKEMLKVLIANAAKLNSVIKSKEGKRLLNLASRTKSRRKRDKLIKRVISMV